MTDVDLHDQAPSTEEHTRLRAAAGLSGYTVAATTAGLEGSWFAMVARDSTGCALGMGRVIGDGAMFLQIVDMAVDPAAQGQGIGTRILRRLLEHTDQHAPGAYISLIADPPGQRLYQSFDFNDVAPSLGMNRRR